MAGRRGRARGPARGGARSLRRADRRLPRATPAGLTRPAYESEPTSPCPGLAPTAVPEHAVYYLEIVTPDIRAAADFYAAAYGFRFGPEALELGNALVATLPDGSLCGIRAPMGEHEQPIVRTYLRVADLGAAVQRAAELGATIAIEDMELAGRGRIAIYFLGGIEQGLWKP